MKKTPPRAASSPNSPDRRGVFDNDSGPWVREWNRQALLLQQAHVIGHAPLRLIETIFYGMSHPAEALQVGRVERE
jgi:hypothetical protein